MKIMTCIRQGIWSEVEEIKKELEVSPEQKTLHVLDDGYYCEDSKNIHQKRRYR